MCSNHDSLRQQWSDDNDSAAEYQQYEVNHATYRPSLTTHWKQQSNTRADPPVHLAILRTHFPTLRKAARTDNWTTSPAALAAVNIPYTSHPAVLQSFKWNRALYRTVTDGPLASFHPSAADRRSANSEIHPVLPFPKTTHPGSLIYSTCTYYDTYAA